MKTKFLYTMLPMLFALIAQPVQAYETWSSKWPQAQTTFYVSIPGENGAWNSAFEAAMNSWSSSGFNFAVVRSSSDPCNTSDRRNGVRFHTSVCGSAFGSTTLAVTRSWRTGSTTVETDIVFNASRDWDLYGGGRQAAIDFQRVAVHELGHALGLNHEQDAPAIMAPNVGNLRSPQADDIAGVRALYGGAGDDYGNSISAAQTIAPNSTTSGTINSGRDVDFFRINLKNRGRLALRTNGRTNTVGTLYSSTGTLLGSNNDGCNNGQNFCLTRLLNAGTYYVKVDGYGTTATGAYSLVARYAVDDYGNTRSEARLISPNSTTSGRINSGSDVDFFKIQVPRSAYLMVRTTGTTRIVGTLYSSTGAVLSSYSQSCGTSNFCVLRPVGAGTYYLKLDGYGQTVTGPYSLVSSFR